MRRVLVKQKPVCESVCDPIYCNNALNKLSWSFIKIKFISIVSTDSIWSRARCQQAESAFSSYVIKVWRKLENLCEPFNYSAWPNMYSELQ